LVLKNGSKIDIPYYSSLLIKEKSTLEFENGSDLNVTGGVFSVDADCKLIFNSGTYEITNNGIITLNCPITLKENAQLIIKGSGYTILNGNINAAPGAILTIEGVSKTTKMIEVNKAVTFTSNLASVTLQNGKIVMSNTSSELIIK
jgi:hypothetical protein